MSDARTDFFDSAAHPAKAAATREDFFSGKVDADELADKNKKSAAELSPPNFSAPYAYFDPEVRRAAGIKGDDIPAAALETAIHVGSGMAGASAGGIAGSLNAFFNHSPLGLMAHHLGLPEVESADVVRGVQDAITYEPSTEGGQAAARAIASPDWNPGASISALGQDWGDRAEASGAPPLLSTAVRMVPDTIATVLGAKAGMGALPEELPAAAMRRAPLDTQAKLNAAASSQSMGAAGAAVDLQKLSPDLKLAVQKAVQQTGGAVNPEAMARHIQADSLPVKVHLSEGQVLGDPRLISEERNARGATAGYVEGFAAQNKALTANLRSFRDTAGENVFSTNQVEHGDTLIGRYKAIDEARTTDISAKYKALRDAAGGDFPVDVKALLGNVKGELGKQLLTHDAPPSVMRTLEEISEKGSMSFEQFENLRTNLARLQRSHSLDGNTRFAAGIIRDQMEQIPMTGAAAQLKPLADAARGAARERFAALEDDPAYKAAVNETVAPDKYVQKFVIGGTRDNVAKLSQAMSGDETATQTMKVATLDHLRQAAGIDGSFNGNFTQAGYNKALRALEPKLGSLLDNELAEHVQNLGDVARYSQLQPEGHYVNNSNTSVAQRALSHGADVLEGAANVKAGGVPVGSWVRQHVTDRAGRKAAAKTFAPGAGLTRLSDLTKIGKDKK